MVYIKLKNYFTFILFYNLIYSFIRNAIQLSIFYIVCGGRVVVLLYGEG
jgi:hypothetical protein